MEPEIKKLTAELLKARKELEQETRARRYAEDKLRRCERIVSAVQDLMSFVDTNYIYQTVNDAYIQYTKRPKTEIIGSSVADLLGQEVFENQDRKSVV